MTDEQKLINLISQASSQILSVVRAELMAYPPAELNLKEVLAVFKTVSSECYWREKGRNY